MQIKFAHTRYVYDSYVDMRALINLSGIGQCYIDEIRPYEDIIYIVYCINGEFRPHIDNHRSESKKAKICYWALERPCGEPKNEKQKQDEFIAGNLELLNKGYIDEVWFSDRNTATYHKDPRAIFMPMGSDTNIFQGPKAWEISNKRYDYIYLSYLTHRRSLVLDRLKENFKMRERTNCWGNEREEGLRNSKFLINIHQDVHPMSEPVRLALAAAAGIPVISETIQDPFPMVPNEHFIQGPWSDLLTIIKTQHTKNYHPLMEMGKKLHNLLCNDYKFGKSIKEHCAKWTNT